MSIRLRLAAQFGAILVITLVLFALAIYFVTQQARREEFTQSLFKRALVVGHAYADGQARADSSHRASYRQYLRQLYRTLPAEEGRVYDPSGRLVFREGQRPPAKPIPTLGWPKCANWAGLCSNPRPTTTKEWACFTKMRG